MTNLETKLESQQEKLKEYAEKNNLQIVKEFADIGSDKDTKRQGFKAMLKFLEGSTDCKTILVTLVITSVMTFI